MMKLVVLCHFDGTRKIGKMCYFRVEFQPFQLYFNYLEILNERDLPDSSCFSPSVSNHNWETCLGDFVRISNNEAGQDCICFRNRTGLKM